VSLLRCSSCIKSRESNIETKNFSLEEKVERLEKKIDRLEDKYQRLEDKYEKLFLSNIKTCHFVNSLFREFTKLNSSEHKDVLLNNTSSSKLETSKTGVFFISLGLAKVLFSNNVFHVNGISFDDIEEHFGEKQIYTYGITTDIDSYMEQIYNKFKFYSTTKDLIFGDKSDNIVDIKKMLFSNISIEMLENSIIILKEFFKKLSPNHTKYRISTDSFKEYYDFLKGQVVILDNNDITAVIAYYNML
jgi:hypothetical protein